MIMPAGKQSILFMRCLHILSTIHFLIRAQILIRSGRDCIAGTAGVLRLKRQHITLIVLHAYPEKLKNLMSFVR